MKLNNFFFPFLLLVFLSCKTAFIPSSHSNNLYVVKDSITSDTITAIEAMLKPYRDSLSGIMNEVIGIAEGDFHKEKNGGSLGNLITDAIFEEALKHKKCEGAIFNTGGIRLPDLMRGKITKGKMLELLPFDNELVILELKGDVLEKWLNLIGEKGGWPVKYLALIQFQNKKLLTSYVDTIDADEKNQIPKMIIKENNTYYIATNDYVANGGDNCDFLKDQKRTNTGLLIRDVVSDYIKREKTIIPNNEKRIQFND